MVYEVLSDGTKLTWYDEEKRLKRSEERPDGTKYYLHPSGKLSYEELPNGTRREWAFPGERKVVEHDGKTYIGDVLHYHLKYEKLSDGTERKYYDTEDNDLAYEKYPDGREVKWSLSHSSRRIKGLDRLPDTYKVRESSEGIKMIYNEKNEVIYHFTKGIEDTTVYLAKEHVAKRKEEKLAKFEGKPKIKRVVEKVFSSKALNDLDVKIAERRIKKSRGE